MVKFLRRAAVAVVAATVLSGVARAYFVIDGHSTLQEMLSFACQTTKVCPGNVIVDSTGSPMGTLANPIAVAPRPYAWTDLGFCTLASFSTAQALTACTGSYGSGIPPAATTVLIDFEGANARTTGDGVTVPNASLGMRHVQTTYWEYTSTALGNLKIAQESAGLVANITFLK